MLWLGTIGVAWFVLLFAAPLVAVAVYLLMDVARRTIAINRLTKLSTPWQMAVVAAIVFGGVLGIETYERNRGIDYDYLVWQQQQCDKLGMEWHTEEQIRAVLKRGCRF